MNPQSNLALLPVSATQGAPKSSPKSAMADTLSLHAQELRHLGTLRRFKRACDEQPELTFFAHDPERLRFDLPYRNDLLTALSVSDDPAVVPWHARLKTALDALDDIHEHMKNEGDRLKVVTRPMEFIDDLPARAKQGRVAGSKRTIFGVVGTLALLLLGGAVWWWQAGGSSEAPTASGSSATAQLAPSLAQMPQQAQIALRIHGSNTIGDSLAPALVQAYVQHKNGQLGEVQNNKPLEKVFTFRTASGAPLQGVEVHAHGSGTAYTALRDGKADIGMSSRPIKDSENTTLSPLFGDMRMPGTEHVIGLDGLAIIVHPSNKIQKLTVEQVAGIFSGQITNWQQLGGESRPIGVHARDDKSGTWDTFKSLVLDRQKLSLNALATRYESSNALSDQVSSDLGAIGFIGLPYVRQARAVPVAEGATAAAFLPTFFTVSTEDYPLSRRLFLYASSQRLDPQAKDFLEFVQSDAGQNVVKQTGFVPQLISAETVQAPADAPAAYAQLATQAQRLSFTFRFQSGSGELDSKAARDMGRLVNYLSRHPNQTVSLLGFTDALGSVQQNAALSKARADSVARLLRASGVIPTQVLGLGGALPVASNNDELGRNKNRRVEVWVK
ncbi:MAG: substrate-binding domain-containing protein [Burkholderiales bacterium]